MPIRLRQVGQLNALVPMVPGELEEMKQEKSYLGDGAYVHIEPGYLVLTTENGLRETNRVCLDEEGLEQLMSFLRKHVLEQEARPGFGASDTSDE